MAPPITNKTTASRTDDNFCPTCGKTAIEHCKPIFELVKGRSTHAGYRFYPCARPLAIVVKRNGK